MKLYHGSFLAVPSPDLMHSRKNLDFGSGFYTTPLREQAAKWCEKFRRMGKPCVINIYEFDENALSSLNVLTFDSYSEEWLTFILRCRRGDDTSDFDIVTGGVADDKVFNTVELFFDGLIDQTEAIRRLRFEKPNRQICFRTETSLRFLQYEGSEEP
jgi:hypothetical protein